MNTVLLHGGRQKGSDAMRSIFMRALVPFIHKVGALMTYSSPGDTTLIVFHWGLCFNIKLWEIHSNYSTVALGGGS